MGALGPMILNAAIKYLSNNPAIVEQLIGQLIPAIIEAVLAELQSLKSGASKA